ncbi:MAG: carboxypeptidase regulatory-like domain-containing protein [Planctomycetota bacterium]
MRKTAFPLVLAVVAVLLAFWFAQRDAAERGRQQRATAAGTPAPRETTPTDATTDEQKEEETAAGWTAQVRLVDDEGSPVAGAVVGRFQDLEFLGPTVRSDADGRCRPSLPAEPWVALGVRHSAYIFKAQWIPAGLDKEITITLTRGAPLTVIVLAPDKRPVAGAAVKAQHTRRQGAVGFWSWRDTEQYGSARTDVDGKAALGGMPQVDVAVTVDQPDYALHESTVEIRGLAPHEHLVRLDAGGVLEGSVLDPDGEGVEGAEVKLRSAVRPRTRSGAGGAFRLESVGVGTAEVIASADGFGPGFFGERLGWDDPVPIHVRAGDTVSGIEIVLGHPTFLLGRVIDDTKQPVEGVEVHGWISGAISFDRSVKSDADGKFRVGPFTVREKGQAQLWFGAGDHVIEQVRGKFAEPGKDLDLGTVKATRKATVRGVVVGEDGKPVEDAMVTARPGYHSVGVKPDGTFEAPRLNPGKISLQAESQDPARKSRPVQLEVAAGEVRESVEILLKPARSIKGRVITPDGKPRSGADLAIQPLDYREVVVDRFVYTSADRTSSDADGRFEFADLPEGKYRVGVRDGSTPWYEPATFLKDPAPRTADAGADDLEFILPLKGGIVTARVVSKRDGRPLRKFEATFIRYKFFLPANNELGWFQGGAFRKELDEPGTWQVDISAAGHAPHRTERFTLKAGEVRDLGTLRLGEGGTIAGTVRDAQGGPVPYTRINILNAKFQTNDDEPFTDQEGGFQLKGISPGVYTVFAISPRHPLVMVPGVNVKEGRRAHVDLEFVPPAPLTIAVTAADGRPVPGAQLSFTFPAIAPLHSKLFRDKIPPGYGSHKADAEGLIRQHCLPPGEVTLTIEADGHEPKTKKLNLKSGEANRAQIRLRRKPK